MKWLKDKKLCLLADSEHYKRHISKLKAITGNARLRDRKNYSQGTFGFYNWSLVLISSNYNLGSFDISAGLERRIRIIEAKNIVSTKHRENMFLSSGITYLGILANALPIIFNWVNSMKTEEARDIVFNNNTGFKKKALQ